MAKTAPNPADQRLDPGDAAGFASSTNINRRHCERVVPMKVLALGLSRTGTTALRQALIDLGYNDCYHYTTPLQENPPDQLMWIEACEAKFLGKGVPYTRKDWDQLLGHCQAATDTPCVVFYKELLEAYPDAQVILTIRDSPDQWFKSYQSTIVPYYAQFCQPPRTLVEKIHRWFQPDDSQLQRFNNTVLGNYHIFQAAWNDYRDGTETAKQHYNDYINEIKLLVPPDNLLVMNLKEGWDPLCKFLGKEKPLYPFPRKNDTASFQRNSAFYSNLINQIVKWNMLKTAGTVLVACVAVGIGMYRYGPSMS